MDVVQLLTEEGDEGVVTLSSQGHSRGQQRVHREGFRPGHVHSGIVTPVLHVLQDVAALGCIHGQTGQLLEHRDTWQ